MGNFTKVKLISAALAVGIFAGCATSTGPAADVTIESFLPSDSSMVMKATKDDARIFENAFFASFAELVVEETGEFSYDKDFAPIFDGEWEMALSMDMAALNEAYYVGPDEFPDFGAVVVFDIEKAGKFEKLIDKIFEGEEEMEKLEDETATYWTWADNTNYIARYGDYFVIAFSERGREEAIARAMNGEGFVLSEGDIAHLSEIGYEDGKGYLYLNYEDQESPFLEELELGQSYSVVNWEENGVRIPSKMIMKEDVDNALYRPYDLEIVNKIPGEGMFTYAEMPALWAYIDEMLLSIEVALGEPNARRDLLAGMTAVTGLEYDEMVAMLDNGFAISMSDSGSAIPYLGVYLNLPEDQVENGKNFVNGMNAYVDEILVLFREFVLPFGVPDTLIAKETVLVNGSGINHVYLDESVIPQEFLTGLPEEISLDLDLYYGVTSDNLLVFALNSDFEEDYGNDILAESSRYQEMVASLNVEGDSVGFFDMQPIRDIFERFELREKLAAEGANDPDFELVMAMLDGFLKIDYAISGTKTDGNEVMSDVLIKFVE